MKLFANTFAILYGAVGVGFASVSAWTSQPVHPFGLAAGAGFVAIAAALNMKAKTLKF